MKRMYKSTTDKKIAGVAAGMAHYFGVDVALSRIVWFVFIVVTGLFPGLLLYVVLAWILPREDEVNVIDVEFEEVNTEEEK